MSRGTFLIVISAMIAGAIGFGIAVYAVPLEEIVQFRVLIDAGLSALTGKSHLDEQDSAAQHPTAPPSNESTEHDVPDSGRRGSSSICDPNDVNCAGRSSAEPMSPHAAPGRDGSTRNSTPNEGVGAPQAPVSQNEPAMLPSLSPSPPYGKDRLAPKTHSQPRQEKTKAKSPRKNSSAD